MLSEMRSTIRANQVKWHLGENPPEAGFDSPCFAVFIITLHSKTKVPIDDKYELREILSPTQNPEVDDIVFYEHGYAMLYFEHKSEPFVVGMTPLGLASRNTILIPNNLVLEK